MPERGSVFDALPDRYKKQAELQLSSTRGRKDPDKNAEPERDTHQALEEHSQAPKISERVYCIVLVYRTAGLRWDLDNVSVKPFLDGLVERGVLEDDSCKQIEGFLKLPRQCKTKAEERTEIEFWKASYFSPFIEEARSQTQVLKGES